MIVNLDSIVVQDKEPIAAAIDDEVVMLSARAGAYFGFNGVGAEIWNMIREPRQVASVCDELAQQYDVDRDVLRQDVVAFLDALGQRGLVRTLENEQRDR